MSWPVLYHSAVIGSVVLLHDPDRADFGLGDQGLGNGADPVADILGRDENRCRQDYPDGPLSGVK